MKQRKKNRTNFVDALKEDGFNFKEQKLINDIITVFGEPPIQAEVNELIKEGCQVEKEFLKTALDRIKKSAENGNREKWTKFFEENPILKKCYYNGWRKYGLIK